MIHSEPALTRLGDLPGPRGLPLLGNLHQINFDRLHLILEAWADSHGTMYGIRIGPQRIVVLSDRSAIDRILREHPERFRRTRQLESAAAEMRLKGVFAAEGDDWRRQRRMVVAALSRARLKDLFPTLEVSLGRLERRWERAAARGERVDLSRDLMRFTVDVTVELAFGVDANTLETPGPVLQRHLDKVFPVLHRRVNAPVAWWRYVRMPADRALDRALDALEHEVGAMVRTTRDRLAAEPELAAKPTNFLEAIVAAVESEDSAFSDAEIFANAGTLLLAGEDTTANTIAWAVHYFTRHPEHFRRARREADAVLAPGSALRSLDQASKLPFPILPDGGANDALLLVLVEPCLLHHPVDAIAAPTRARRDLDEVEHARDAGLASLAPDEVIDRGDETGLVRRAQRLTARLESPLGSLQGKLKPAVIDRRGLAHGADVELEPEHVA